MQNSDGVAPGLLIHHAGVGCELPELPSDWILQCLSIGVLGSEVMDTFPTIAVDITVASEQHDTPNYAGENCQPPKDQLHHLPLPSSSDPVSFQRSRSGVQKPNHPCWHIWGTLDLLTAGSPFSVGPIRLARLARLGASAGRDTSRASLRKTHPHPSFPSNHLYIQKLIQVHISRSDQD